MKHFISTFPTFYLGLCCWFLRKVILSPLLLHVLTCQQHFEVISYMSHLDGVTSIHQRPAFGAQHLSHDSRLRGRDA